MGKINRGIKAPARRAKSTAGGAKTTQAKVALNKTTYNPLISQSLLKAVSKTVNSIDRALIGERRTSINIGGLLARLRGEIATHLSNAGNSASSYQVGVAFHNFVQIRFKIGESRAKEFMRLAERKDLHRLGLPTSVLVELSRLEASALKRFMKKHPTASLKRLPFKEIKNLVRSSNPKKRVADSNGSTTGEHAVNPKVIAEKLKTTFEKVRDNFDGDSTLDRNLDSVLGEISKWYFDKKVA